jgi:hypothetical protein
MMVMPDLEVEEARDLESGYWEETGVPREESVS